MQRIQRAFVSFVAVAAALGALATADIALFDASARAEAEKVEARKSADVFATPGEQSRVVTRVRAGKEMTVLQTKNRWIKVRVNGRTGWITRSNVTSVELAEPAPRAKRRRPFVEGRSTRRGSRGKGPGDRIGGDATDEEIEEEEEDEDDERSRRERKRAKAKRKRAQAREMDEEILDEDSGELSEEDEEEEEASEDEDEEGEEEEEETEPEREYVVVTASSTKLYEEASSKSDSIDSASEGARLFVVERDGKWIKVETEDGESGWVRASKVEDGAGGAAYQWEKFAKRAHAGLGYATLTQNFTSAGTDPRSNYQISSAAAVLSLGGDVLYDYSKKYLIGGDLGYRLHYASPGIRYSDDMGNAVNIGFKTHQVDLGVRGGYKLSHKTGMAAYGRLGYHYERMGINNVDDFTKNLAYLPSEILQGVTIGGIFEMPRMTKKFSLRAGFDYLKLLAARKQTVRLEDGTSSSPMAAWLYGLVQYDWRTNYKITAQYQFTYAKTNWSGMAAESMRPHMSDSASRKDSSHLLMLGLGRSF